MNPKPLARRTIRKALIDRHGWTVKSKVSGWLEITVPGPFRSREAEFDAEVRRAVASLGYTPTITRGAGCVLVRTAETEAQTGRGGHGFSGSRRVEPIAPVPCTPFIAAATAKPIRAVTLGSWHTALDPVAPPLVGALTRGSRAAAWHLDLAFEAYEPDAAHSARWRDEAVLARETWNKRPLLAGTASGCTYACGEIEIAARFRAAGYEAYWISEWSGFPHVQEWRPFCVTRKELRTRLPNLWSFDQALRERRPELGDRGGHPDVAAWLPGSRDYVFAEYKGPGDTIRVKQLAWVEALHELTSTDGNFAVVRPVLR